MAGMTGRTSGARPGSLSIVAVLAVVGRPGARGAAAPADRSTSPPRSRAPSRSTRAPTCGSSACRSARSRRVTPGGHRRHREDVVRREVRRARRRQGRDHLAGDRRRPVHPADAGVQAGAPSWPTTRVLEHGVDRPRRSSSTRSTRASTTSPSRSGPDGANKQGRADPAARLDREELRRPGRAVPPDASRTSASSPATLDDNKEELFGTARQVERFVNALAKNDGTVRRFNDSLASARRPAQGRALRPGRRAAQPRDRA